MLAKRLAPTLLLLLAGPALSGCYLAHVARGQLSLLAGARDVEAVLADPETPADVGERLRLVESVRAFGRELGLDVDGQYTRYVDWPGDRVVTTVVAARPGELEATGFWFPVVGRVPYKGFFDPARAEAEAERQRRRGRDVCVVPVVAYSTLGWFDDPLTGPMLRLERGRLVETLLHELVHATVFVASQPDFNEGLATFVGQEAALRFAEHHDGAAGGGVARRRVEEDRAVAAALGRYRERLAALYAEAPDGAERRRRRAALEAETRAALAALPLETRDAGGLAERARLNDACQALAGTYQADLPRYARRLEELEGDLGAFLGEAREAARADDPRTALAGASAVDEVSSSEPGG